MRTSGGETPPLQSRRCPTPCRCAVGGCASRAPWAARRRPSGHGDIRPRAAAPSEGARLAHLGRRDAAPPVTAISDPVPLRHGERPSRRRGRRDAAPPVTAISFPSSAGEGGAKRRMGCGPPLRLKSDCATVSANFRRTLPAFRTPSGLQPPSRFAEKGAHDGSAHPRPHRSPYCVGIARRSANGGAPSSQPSRRRRSSRRVWRLEGHDSACASTTFGSLAATLSLLKEGRGAFE